MYKSSISVIYLMTKETFFSYIKYIRIQLLVISFFLFFLMLSFIKIIPSPDELLVFLKQAFIRYGVVIIFIASLLENLFGFNTYFPGAVVIFTGMSLSKGNLPLAVITFLSIFIPVLIANSINFYLGRKTSESNNPILTSKELISKLIVNLWHPYLASIISFTIGSTRDKYSTFIKYFFPVSLCWNIIWGIIAYNYGSFLTKDSDIFLFLFILYLVVWTLFDTIKYFKFRE